MKSPEIAFVIESSMFIYLKSITDSFKNLPGASVNHKMSVTELFVTEG